MERYPARPYGVNAETSNAARDSARSMSRRTACAGPDSEGQVRSGHFAYATGRGPGSSGIQRGYPACGDLQHANHGYESTYTYDPNRAISSAQTKKRMRAPIKKDEKTKRCKEYSRLCTNQAMPSLARICCYTFRRETNHPNQIQRAAH